MMFIETVITALAVSIFLKGKFRNLQNTELQHIELIFIGFLMEVVLVQLIKTGLLINNGLIYALYLLMYVLLFVFVYLNRKLYQVLIMGAGFLFNAIAIFTNGGTMPVSSKLVSAAGHINEVNEIAARGLYKVSDGSTNFYFLCDVIPKPYVIPSVISIGDIFIAAGLFLLILKLMGSRILLLRKEK